MIDVCSKPYCFGYVYLLHAVDAVVQLYPTRHVAITPIGYHEYVA